MGRGPMGREMRLEDIALLLVDGDNLLHEVRGSRDEGGVAWLLPRLARWRPDGMRIVVALDGHPVPGEPSRRRASRGIEFRHSGSRSADDLLIELLSARPYAERTRSAVVTRDHELADRARRTGGGTRAVDWLLRQLNAAAAPSGAASVTTSPVGVGQGRPPRSRGSDPADPDTVREPWRSGRGATRKRGNPRRGAKPSRRCSR